MEYHTSRSRRWWKYLRTERHRLEVYWNKWVSAIHTRHESKAPALLVSSPFTVEVVSIATVAELTATTLGELTATALRELTVRMLRGLPVRISMLA